MVNGLSAELMRRGIDLEFDEPLDGSGLTKAELIRHYELLDLRGADHIIAFASDWLRYFERIPPECAKVLVDRCPGIVCQFHAHGGYQPPPSNIMNLAITKQHRANSRHSRFIGWAADTELLRPNQDPDELRILIDHADYAAGASRRQDLSDEIFEDCLAFASSDIWRDKYKRIRLRRWVPGGFADVLPGDVQEKYTRGMIPYAECVAEYAKTHLFFISHTEDTGQTCVELAMCGALVMVPRSTGGRDFLPKDRLDTIRHLLFDRPISWLDVLDLVDVEASRRVAQENSWAKVVGHILEVCRPSG